MRYRAIMKAVFPVRSYTKALFQAFSVRSYNECSSHLFKT